jgi:hypothetical protein
MYTEERTSGRRKAVDRQPSILLQRAGASHAAAAGVYSP